MPAAPGSGMILPPVDPATGSLAGGNDTFTDRRIPPRAGSWRDGTLTEPRALGHYLPCAGDRPGRHLWDVLEASYGIGHDDDEHGPYAESIRHSTRLTCVLCGLILTHRGEYVAEEFRRVDPAPVAVGTLRAQQVDGSWLGGAWDVFDVSDLEARVCRVSWGRTTRGREYYATRIGEGDGVKLEAPTLAGLLRKIAKARG